ncbi:MAG: hypothetical protein NXI21_05815 [Alphaproteobacteria bacterium]|nr:hypothetical protein [Alphaproteobacteria bacterium]
MSDDGSRGDGPADEDPVDALATLEGVCDAALITSGAGYPAAEERLFACGPQCLETLQKMAAASPDPIAPLYAEEAALWLPRERHEMRSALAYMRGMAVGADETPRGAPSPTSLARDIAHLYGEDLGTVLVLRAAKVEREPDWRVLTSLVLLHEHHAPRALPALIRLITVLEPGRPLQAAMGMLDAWSPAAVHDAFRREAAYWRAAAFFAVRPPKPPDEADPS